MHLTLAQQALDENTTSEQLRQLAQQNLELARLVAKNANAEPDLLRELAESKDEKTRCEVANNPNTPTDILWKLGEEFPEEVLTNSIFPLLMLENPNLVADIPEETLVSLLKVDLVPESFLTWVVDKRLSEKTLLAVAMNSKTSKDILENIFNYKSLRIPEYVKNENIIPSVKLHINYSNQINGNCEEVALIIDTISYQPSKKILQCGKLV